MVKIFGLSRGSKAEQRLTRIDPFCLLARFWKADFQSTEAESKCFQTKLERNEFQRLKKDSAPRGGPCLPRITGTFRCACALRQGMRRMPRDYGVPREDRPKEPQILRKSHEGGSAGKSSWIRKSLEW